MSHRLRFAVLFLVLAASTAACLMTPCSMALCSVARGDEANSGSRNLTGKAALGDWTTDAPGFLILDFGLPILDWGFCRTSHRSFRELEVAGPRSRVRPSYLKRLAPCRRHHGLHPDAVRTREDETVVVEGIGAGERPCLSPLRCRPHEVIVRRECRLDRDTGLWRGLPRASQVLEGSRGTGRVRRRGS